MMVFALMIHRFYDQVYLASLVLDSSPSDPHIVLLAHSPYVNPSDFSRLTLVRVHNNGYFLVLSQNHLLPQGLNRFCGFQNYVVHILVVSSLASHSLDPDGNARAIDGRILQVSREDIADILEVANGPDNLFSQQRGTPDVIQTNPNNHVGVATTEINPDLSRQPKGQASIDGTTETSIDRVTPTSIDRDDPRSIERRYEFGNRAFDMYGARKFTWEQRDE
ncbi:hypothetical protein DY000_02042918 [Brassica cretica]|uniref:Uncharacterized protein n=1 Tax=Brassica cretica TaxID=69181 RepID=A0ABQ7BBW4_BRACR|nr:hypothetical protein DY000_02042918 [Brassica cretica]